MIPILDDENVHKIGLSKLKKQFKIYDWQNKAKICIYDEVTGNYIVFDENFEQGKLLRQVLVTEEENKWKSLKRYYKN